MSQMESARKAHKLCVKAKPNVLKTSNVYQKESYLELCINSQYKVLLNLPLLSRYLILRPLKLCALLLAVATKSFINRKSSHDLPIF